MADGGRREPVSTEPEDLWERQYRKLRRMRHSGEVSAVATYTGRNWAWAAGESGEDIDMSVRGENGDKGFAAEDLRGASRAIVKLAEPPEFAIWYQGTVVQAVTAATSRPVPVGIYNDSRDQVDGQPRTRTP